MLLDTGSTITLNCLFSELAFIERMHEFQFLVWSQATPVILEDAHTLSCALGKDHIIEMDSFILSSLTSSLPAQTIDTSSSTWKEISTLPLADPTFCTPGSVDVIVGTDHIQLWSLYTGERKYFGKDYPIALNTIFGWIITCTLPATTTSLRP